ncbi:hypothetical protein ACFFQW_09500 [Umezawaea endophytica]|uniref:Capsular polysaccharide biosynthesis protein n=1 Tax=Umezawaea endophytica TaxID=1654476 RepID=A0A9X3A4I4_9PSEU|nr:hypothetical protein [Umezawaea endophytica]MCS7481288.1 hypothetical protein [Umezawaea endophytica]
MWKTIVVLLRRWYVAVPVFVVTLGLAAGTYAAVPMRYESTGTVVLTSPAEGASSEATKQRGLTNPFLAFDMSLGVSAAIIIQSLSTESVQKSLGADGEDTTYVISGAEIGGPFINVVAESTSEAEAKATVTRVLERVQKDLADRQAALQAPPGTFIKVETVIQPTKPEPQRGGKLRATGAAVVLGFAAMLTVVYGLESRAQAKRKKKGKDDKGKADGPPPPPDDDDDQAIGWPKAEAPQNGDAVPWAAPTLRMKPATTGSKRSG